MTDAPLTGQQIAAIRAEFERTTHPDWRDVHPTGVLLAALDQRDAENAKLRAEIREWLNLRQARTSLQAFRHAIGGTATQITELIHGIGRATGPLARAQREAAHYRARWESTVIEARRQHAEAERLRAEQLAARRAREIATGRLLHFAAEAHRRKWTYDTGAEGPPSPAFDALHQLGNEMRTAVDQLTAAAVPAPTASAEGCGCQSYTHPGHYPSCPTRAAAPSATT